MTTKFLSMTNVEKRLVDAIKSPTIGDSIHTSLENFLKCIDAIIRHNGEDGWANDVTNAEGKPLFSEGEKRTFEDAFRPFVDIIMKFFNRPRQTGGNLPSVPTVSPIATPIAIPVTNSPVKPIVKSDKSLSIDGAYKRAIDSIASIGDSMHEFAQSRGILQFEQSYDGSETSEATDVYPLGFLESLPYPVTKILAKIPVPIRTIVFFAYTALDVARILIGVSPTDSPSIRKVLSIVVAIADFLKGDWKKAILSFAGFFSQDYILMGIFGKLIISVFELMAPDLQFSIAYGLLDVIKSLLAGVLLELVKIFGLAGIRTRIITGFKEIEKIIQDNMHIFKKETGKDIVPSYLIPSFDNIQNIQAIIGHKEFACSSGFLNIVDDMVGTPPNVIIKIALELLRVPIDIEFRAEKCGSTDTSYTRRLYDKAADKGIVAPVKAQSEEAEEPVKAVAPLEEAKTVEPVAPVEEAKPVKAPVAPATNENPQEPVT